MLSQKSKYALRAVLYLAIESENGRQIGGKEVSEELEIPLAFTSKILQQLVRDNLISSAKGPGGGFFLTDKNYKNPIINVVDSMGDLSVFYSCGLGLPNCSEKKPCPIHNHFKIGRNALLELFSSKTIADLGKEVDESELFLVR